MVIDYFVWWYTAGLKKLVKYLKAFIIILADNFSVGIILRTFFQPWKRDISSTRGLSLDQRLRVWLFNLIARCFGMFIKGITFLIFLIIFFLLLIIDLISLIIWILYPFIIIGGIIYIIYRVVL